MLEDLDKTQLKASIQALLKLQEIDGILFKINHEASVAPSDHQEAEKRTLDEQNRLRAIERVFRDLDRERRSLELRHITLLEDIKKAESKRREVRNTKEEFAANKEYENFQKKLQDVEKFLKEKEGLTQQKQEELQKTKAAFEEAQKILEEKKADRAKRLAELSAEKDQLSSKREAYISVVHSDIFSMYERVQKLRKGSGVALEKNGICTGCFVAIPPQQKAKLQQLQGLITCSSCSRILFPASQLEKSEEEPVLKTSNAG